MNTYRTKPLTIRTAEEYAEDSLHIFSNLYREEPQPRLPITYLKPTEIMILGEKYELSGNNICNNNYRSLMLKPETIKQYRIEMFNPEYAKLDYAQKLEEREKFVEITTKLERELRTVCADDKLTIKKIDELDGLLVCEANEFLMKMLTKIEKRGTPKAMHQYAALMELRKQPVITCEV